MSKIVIIGLLVALVGAAGYFIVNQQTPSPEPIPSSTPTPTSTPQSSPTPTSIPTPTPSPTPIPSPFSDRQQSFETVARSGHSGHDDRKNYAIKDISEWRNLWDIVNATVFPKPVLPNIDFNNEMIVAVFMGQRNTGGYSIEIVEIIEKANSLEIMIKETSPSLSPGDVVTQAFTQPFHIVKTKRIDKEVLFAEVITKTVGEQEGSFLIQKINPDTVEGIINYIGEGVIAVPYFPTPGTLHIGDEIGSVCDSISEKLTNIDFAGQTVTFTKTEIIWQGPPPPCPVCLSSGTLIDTPFGAVLVTGLEIGMPVWTTDKAGNRVSGVVTKTSIVPVSSTHQVVHLVLDDGREVFVSPGHPTIDGRMVGDLVANDLYNDTRIITATLILYNNTATYDILPSGETGFYWANGILLDSTLH